MNVLVVDYKLGNIRSLCKALQHVGASYTVSANPDDFACATHLVLPGVGAFEQGMQNLASLGLVGVLRQHVVERGKPLLGICLGMQLLFSSSEESSSGSLAAGLDFISGNVRRLRTPGIKVPHIGWNEVFDTDGMTLFDGIPDGNDFYFIHSYHAVPAEPVSLAYTDYGGRIVASICKDNIMGIQFHPEKSQRVGLRLLKNFVEHGNA